jgi:proline iminopeptidase
MGFRYRDIEPYDHGLLDVGDGHRLYWEACGNPHGKPALVLHGGPGSGCTPASRRYFDPKLYRIILFDQRQCGRSTPHASAPITDLSTNTTQHLLADIERLRRHLDVERWLLFGGSWGAALGLAYAQTHPERVSEAIFTGVATGRRMETDLLTRGLGRLFPAAWTQFQSGVPPEQRAGDLSAAYSRLLHDADATVRANAARAWCDWEIASLPTSAPAPRYESADFRLAFARIVTHYWRHGSWLDEGKLLENATQLAGIPGVIVQGNLDLGNLLGTPWELVQRWRGSELIVVDDAGHSAGAPGIVEALTQATDRYARRP